MRLAIVLIMNEFLFEDTYEVNLEEAGLGAVGP